MVPLNIIRLFLRLRHIHFCVWNLEQAKAETVKNVITKIFDALHATHKEAHFDISHISNVVTELRQGFWEPQNPWFFEEKGFVILI